MIIKLREKVKVLLNNMIMELNQMNIQILLFTKKSKTNINVEVL